jgi:hypothetical protein
VGCVGAHFWSYSSSFGYGRPFGSGRVGLVVAVVMMMRLPVWGGGEVVGIGSGGDICLW